MMLGQLKGQCLKLACEFTRLKKSLASCFTVYLKMQHGQAA